MAKIYETPADLERDRLKEVARVNEAAKKHSATSVLFGIFIGVTGFVNEGYEKFADKTLKKTRTGFSRYSNKIIGYLGAAAATLSIFTYFSERNAQKKAEADLAKLGSTQIVMPASAVPLSVTSEIAENPALVVGCGSCYKTDHADKLQKQAQSAVQKTL
jgi:hypothetical protein